MKNDTNKCKGSNSGLVEGARAWSAAFTLSANDRTTRTPRACRDNTGGTAVQSSRDVPKERTRTGRKKPVKLKICPVTHGHAEVSWSDASLGATNEGG